MCHFHSIGKAENRMKDVKLQRLDMLEMLETISSIFHMSGLTSKVDDKQM